MLRIIQTVDMDVLCEGFEFTFCLKMVLLLEEYDYMIVGKEGKKNVNVGAFD